jgi:hypothetical protein
VREATTDERCGARDPETRLTDVAPLVTSGLIGPVANAWGDQGAKFAKRTWAAPVVDLHTLRGQNDALWTWTQARLVPKLVVATQTRVIEVIVDELGQWFPSVPTLAVTLIDQPADADELWRVAAVVSSPAIAAWAFHRHAGTALSVSALKVSARQLLDAPLPRDERAWSAGAESLRAASIEHRRGDLEAWKHQLVDFALSMNTAYGLDVPEAKVIADWWFVRLPPS